MAAVCILRPTTVIFPVASSCAGGRVTENTAGVAGGGIFAGMVHLQLQNGEISRNAASGHGGVFAAIGTIVTTGPNMRIRNNNPINIHESNHSLFTWFVTPDIWRFGAVFVVASGATVYRIVRRQNQGVVK